MTLIEFLQFLTEKYEPFYYAGIGSRAVEKMPVVKFDINLISNHLSGKGFILRSGGADGADKAFEDYAAFKQIFLPWKGFNGSASQFFNPPQEAFSIAENYHPGWKHLKPSVRKLMARNVQQILGPELNSPSQFVVCWTPDGADGTKIKTSKETGGTGQAIRIAADYGIPVYNLKAILAG